MITGMSLYKFQNMRGIDGYRVAGPAQAHTWRHCWLVTVLHFWTGTFSHFLGPSET